MAETAKTGLLDLEKELTCSICTEVLYQPLTLLDCLHTFCGSCLKEWFAWQGSQATSATANPYTCPSCRASVRETRPNATVTTLLDMYIQANPSSGKSAEEKGERDAKYKPGDVVIPKVRGRGESEDEEDRRMVEEVREMSLREVGGRGPRSYERGARHRHRSRDSRDDEARQRRRMDEQRARRSNGQPGADSRSQARHIEHQSSLRSLISNSDVDSAEMEEEILRQIEDEGLLDGIDLNTIDVSQVDELSERIAEAYRRRHGQRSGSQDTRSEDSRGTRSRATRVVDSHQSRHQHARSTGTADHVTHSSHIPVSRPQRREAYPITERQRRRPSSESRRHASPVLASTQVQRQAARSAIDLSNRPQTSHITERRPSGLFSQGRRTTEPRPRRLSDNVRRSQGRPSSSSGAPATHDQGHISVQTPQPASLELQSNSPTHITSPVVQVSGVAASNARQRTSDSVDARTPETTRPSTSSSTTSRIHPTLFPEPSVSCERCGKPGVQYELHENCSACHDGNYNLCHRCYRLGLGCLHWYGFGNAAWQRFQLQGSSNQQLPHTLMGHRYLRPNPENVQPIAGDDKRFMTTEEPSKRLQSGAFCANCSNFSNDCFWKCDYCNEGEWGYCNPCVNQGKCCTHPLLPVAHISTTKSKGQHSDASFAPITSPRLVQNFQSSDLVSSGQFRPLTFSTNCNICKYPIQPSNTRFHCPECDAGDYDICTNCYLKLVSAGMISKENGDKGWRRCLEGHRMVVVGFEDSLAGQRRVIVKDLVGGHALKDEPASEPAAPAAAAAAAAAVTSEEWSWRDGAARQVRTVPKKVAGNRTGTPTTSTVPLLQKYPPDGGIGLRVQALWSYWPREGVKDELAFPKGAELREVEDINGDWFWGCYAGGKGLFPGNYVRVLDVVTM